jgi:hypothetical protein
MMARLEPQGDWEPLVNRAVDDLLRALVEVGPDEWTYESLEVPDTGDEAHLFRWEPPESDVENRRAPAAPVRELLTSYSMSLLAAAGAGTGTLLCDDGNSIVDCEFILRPRGTPYYRCVGHAPPDCYDASYQTIGCP